ncbi:MAG: CtsR family transcriptional regulator [Christensenellales bacterium]
MSALSDIIELFINDLFEEHNGQIELQRNELAQQFKCAPSQINYVLSTRFTPERGYLIESRRGGGGCIRLVRLDMDPDEPLAELISSHIKDTLSEREARHLIDRLKSEGVIADEEAGLINAALKDSVLKLPPPLRDAVRSSILKSMLIAILSRQ